MLNAIGVIVLFFGIVLLCLSEEFADLFSSAKKKVSYAAVILFFLGFILFFIGAMFPL